MKVLRSDNGREYVSNSMKNYLENCGIRHEPSAPYTPEQNGKAERENRTIVECARSILHGRSVPIYLWAEAINTAVYILNRVTNSRNPEKTPYELWTGRKPRLDHLRVFGCDAYMLTPEIHHRILEPKSKKVMMVGYENTSHNYRLFDPEKKKIYVSTHVEFHEEAKINEEKPSSESNYPVIFLFNDEKGQGNSHVEEDKNSTSEKVISQENEFCQNLDSEPEDDFLECDDEQTLNSIDDSQNIEINKSKVTIEISPRRLRSSSKNKLSNDSQKSDPTPYELRDRSKTRAPDRLIEANIVEAGEPITYHEATTGPDAEKWKEAIRKELESHSENGTWNIVEKPAGRQEIDSKWVFKIKPQKNGQSCRYKARLCARGFRQVHGIDYSETFAPVVRYDTVRMMLALAAYENLEMAQFDVSTAFLYGNLEEKIYMKIPEGLELSSREGKSCLLKKSIYGLKQSSRCWNRTFSRFLKDFGFKASASETSLYVGEINYRLVYLLLFVDDGLVLAKNKSDINIVIKALKDNFKITVNEPDVFVGMQIVKSKNGIFIHQSDYVNKILNRFGMSECNPATTPIETGTYLSKSEKCVDVPYREAIGSLMFLAVVSRPDIAYAVNYLSRFLTGFGDCHWKAIKRIFRYLKGTLNFGISFKNNLNNLEIVGYCDADYAADVDTRRSTSGHVFYLANGPVSWLSQRQSSVVLSTTFQH